MRLLVSFLLLLITSSVLSGQTEDNKIKIVFRFDDYMLTQNVTFDSILDVFKKNSISLTLGVVPYNEELIFNELSQDQLNDLRDRIKNNEIEIALHGFNHTDNKLSGRSLLKREILSEFYNMEYNDQVVKIKKGKEALDSLLNTNTKVFIPPFNSYDDNTIKALAGLDFEVISASMDGYSGPDIISYIPYTISDLTKLPGLLRMDPDDDYTVIVVIHPYSFIGGIKTDLTEPVYFSKLDTMLNWINGQDNILTVSFSALGKSEEFSALRFKMNSTDNNMLVKFLEEFNILRHGVYNTTEYQRKHARILGLFNVVFHVMVFFIFYFTAKIFRRLIKPTRLIRILFISLCLLLILAVLYKAFNSHALIIYVMFLTTIVVAFSAGLFNSRDRSLK
jgi:peptidoglycan/xylan/chitin deacetylase (PgdA/CDA1 family)